MRHEMARVDFRLALDKEVEALKTLRESDGSKYRCDPAFTLIKFYDHMRATFYLHHRMDTVVQPRSMRRAANATSACPDESLRHCVSHRR
jgi:hypothetical protein